MTPVRCVLAARFRERQDDRQRGLGPSLTKNVVRRFDNPTPVWAEPRFPSAKKRLTQGDAPGWLGKLVFPTRKRLRLESGAERAASKPAPDRLEPARSPPFARAYRHRPV